MNKLNFSDSIKWVIHSNNVLYLIASCFPRTTIAFSIHLEGIFLKEMKIKHKLYDSKQEVLQADYVVIGSGGSGCPVARFLSDDPNHSVILIEAGPDLNDDPNVFNPANFIIASSLNQAQYMWPGATLSQTALQSRTVPYRTGRLFGGATSINGTTYAWPTTQKLLQWQAAGGDTFWSVERLRALLKMLETYHGQTPDPAARGTSGPVSVEQTPTTPTPVAQKFAQAVSIALGVPINLDYNDPNTPIGAYELNQLFQKPDRTRESSATAFLGPEIVDHGEGVGDRKLKILFETTVTRLLSTFEKVHDDDKSESNCDSDSDSESEDEESKCTCKHKCTCNKKLRPRIYGVRAVRNLKYIDVLARKKVILCAGVKTTELMLHAGLGPRAELESLGIRVLSDLPSVGKDLQDHNVISTIWSKNPADVGVPVDDPQAIFAGGAWLPDPTTPTSTIRNVQFSVLPFDSLGFVSMTLILPLQPVSRGTIVLAPRSKNDPLRLELADPEYLVAPADFQTAFLTLRNYITSVAAQLAAIDPLYQLLSPPLSVINDDAALTNFIQSQTNIGNPTYHYTSHCKLGFSRESGAVVDPTGKVFGVEGLLIADNSITPTITDGNTAMTAILVATNVALIELGIPVKTSSNSFVIIVIDDCESPKCERKKKEKCKRKNKKE